MLTQEQNEMLTQVGKGTPMGELLRRYWHPIAASAELEEKPTKVVRLLGEDLVLYKNKSGEIGLIDRFCPHRRVDLSYGIPEYEGLRCMYHGWMFNSHGQCIEQPFEETVRPDGRFKEKVTVAAYPVEELGGLLFAYLGPNPAPLVPRWDLFVTEHAWRDIGFTVLPCNWVQCQENSTDPVHAEWLHGVYGLYLAKQTGAEVPPWRVAMARPHQKIGFEKFAHGVFKKRVVEGTTEEDDIWKIGHPWVFPNILRSTTGTTSTEFQIRVPIDDHNTLHVVYTRYQFPKETEVPTQKKVPYYEIPLYIDGKLNLEVPLPQDFMAWVTQGPITDRTIEKLGESDVGVIQFRQMLFEAMAIVGNGGDPMNVIRDPKENECIMMAQENIYYSPDRNQARMIYHGHQKYNPKIDEIISMFPN